MNEKPSEQPRKEASVELGHPSLDRKTVNDTHKLFFPGAHSLHEPHQLIEEVVDSIRERGGWPVAMSQVDQEKFLQAALRISREWVDDDPLIGDLARLLREHSRQIAA